jgi:hypothetical protein
MLAYLTIFAASICGYAGAPLWSPLLAAAGLFSISYARHQRLIKRGFDRGFHDEIDDTLWSCAMNAATTTGGAFAFGYFVHAFG